MCKLNALTFIAKIFAITERIFIKKDMKKKSVKKLYF